MLVPSKYTPRRGWWPTTTVSEMENELNRMFQDFFTPITTRHMGETETWYPPVDILEDEGQFIVKAELPGLKEKDIHVDVEGNTLSIRGEKKEEKEIKEGCFYKHECSYGSFYRAFQLPDNLKMEDIKAKYKNGILEIDLPKGSKGKPKHIDVKVS